MRSSRRVDEVREGMHRSIGKDDDKISPSSPPSVRVPKERDHTRPAAAHQPTHSAEMGLEIRGTTC